MVKAENYFLHFYRQMMLGGHHVSCFHGNSIRHYIMADFFERAHAKLRARTMRENGPHGCLYWVGAVARTGYGRMLVTMDDGTKQILRVHRVAYMVAHHLTPGQVPQKTPTGEQLDVSHICHSKECVEPTHLVLEPHSTNNVRKICFNQGFCTNLHQPPCIL